MAKHTKQAKHTRLKRKHAHLKDWAHVDREWAARATRIDLGAAYDLLELDANYGLYVVQQACDDRVELRPGLTSLVALFLFHRGVELLDAISALVKAGCVAPAYIVLRSYLESVLGCRYLLTVNDERIAAAVMMSDVMTRMEHNAQDAAKHAPGSRPTIRMREAREFIRQEFDQRLWNEARRELERLNATSSVPVPWYQTFGGPRTLGGLSGRIRDDVLEEIFAENYDRWSAAVHCTDLLDSIPPEVAGDLADNEYFRPLRRRPAEESSGVVTACHSLFLITLVHLLEYFRTAPKGIREWHEAAEKLSRALQ